MEVANEVYILSFYFLSFLTPPISVGRLACFFAPITTPDSGVALLETKSMTHMSPRLRGIQLASSSLLSSNVLQSSSSRQLTI